MNGMISTMNIPIIPLRYACLPMADVFHSLINEIIECQMADWPEDVIRKKVISIDNELNRITMLSKRTIRKHSQDPNIGFIEVTFLDGSRT